MTAYAACVAVTNQRHGLQHTYGHREQLNSKCEVPKYLCDAAERQHLAHVQIINSKYEILKKTFCVLEW